MSINTFPSAIVTFAVVLLVVGVVSGLTVSGSELVNPFSGVAQLERDKVEVKYLDQQRQIDMDYYAQSKQIELEALRDKYRQERSIANERHQREIEQIERREQIVNAMLPIIAGVILLAVLIVSGGLAYRLVCAGRTQLIAAQAQMATQAEQITLQQRAAMRQARELARQREREMRQQAIDSQNRLRALFPSTASPDGRKGEVELSSEPVTTLWGHN